MLDKSGRRSPWTSERRVLVAVPPAMEMKRGGNRVLFEAIRRGSEIFHADEPVGGFYDAYMSDTRAELWEHPEALDDYEVGRLIKFLNEWKTRYQTSRTELLKRMQRVRGLLTRLHSEDLLNIDFNRDLPNGVTFTVQLIFEALAECRLPATKRYESTGTSKILHTVNPRLFVIWDASICGGYAVGREQSKGYDYAFHFLPRVQKLAKRAIAEYVQVHQVSKVEAERALCACGHTLAKVMDEFNYAKYTRNSDEVWDAELAPY